MGLEGRSVEDGGRGGTKGEDEMHGKEWRGVIFKQQKPKGRRCPTDEITKPVNETLATEVKLR
jgi:hypothetical protein